MVRSTLAPTSFNGAMAPIASFYDHLILSGYLGLSTIRLRRPTSLRGLGRLGVARAGLGAAPSSKRQIAVLLSVTDRVREGP